MSRKLFALPEGLSWRRFAVDLKKEISDDNVSNGAAALAYYLMLAIFPAAIALLSILPYLPIPHLQQAIMDLIGQALPDQAAKLLTGVVNQVTTQKQGGLLSFGLLFTIWAASSGLYAVMQQLNITYDVKEGRPFWKARGTALLLTMLFFLLIIGAFALVVFGGVIQTWLISHVGENPLILASFSIARWAVILIMLTLGFALTYYFGPDVEQRFQFISPGSAAGVLLLIGASLGFRFYVSHFGKYSATYGSLGAVIVLLLWLYITGAVIILGSEVNALMEHYSARGKSKGEKTPEKTGPGTRVA